MVKGKARAAGSFLGGLANNPAIVIIALVLGGLFIFRDRISGALGSIGEGLGDINIQLPSLPEIKLPSLPEITLPSLPEIKLPEFTFPDFQFPEITLPDIFGGGGTPDQDPTIPSGIGLGGAIAERRRAQEEALALSQIPDRDIQDDIQGLSPSQAFAFIERGVIPTGFIVVGGVLVPETTQAAPSPENDLDFGVQSFLPDPQQFGGGGLSFIGGSVSPTPIEFLSLSQIIDMFNVTASQAANLRAIAQGFTVEEQEFLGGNQDIGGFLTGFNPPAVSDPQFEGLTPQQIALQLTGGNISNF